MAKTERNDPFGNFKFRVEIDGIATGKFYHCTGLAQEIEVVEFQEGGVNHKVHKRLGQAKWPNIVLKRGFVGHEFWSWAKSCSGEDAVERKNGSIILLDDKGTEVGRWNFEGGWPCKVEGPELNSTGAEAAIETVEIAHEGIVEYRKS